MTRSTGPHPRPTVIVAEGDRDLREMLGAALRRAGYQPDLHPDGTSALAAAAKQPPAIYLLDVELTGMSGIEACQIIKNSNHLRRPVVLTGTQLPLALTREANAAGADEMLVKPYRLNDLDDALDRAVAGAY